MSNERAPQVNRRKVRLSLANGRAQRREGTSRKTRRGMPRRNRKPQPRVQLEQRIRELERIIRLYLSDDHAAYEKAAEAFHPLDPNAWTQYVIF